MSYKFISLTSENIKDLIYLYKHIFGEIVTLNELLAKFDTSYLGTGYFGYLAYDKEKPIAFQGVVPVLMKYNEKTELAAQYTDSMTLPIYRGKGILTELIKLTYDALRKENVKFIWAFPNQNSEYVFKNKLDWQFNERIQGFSIKTTLLPIEKIARKFDITNRLYEKKILKCFKIYKTDAIINGSVFFEKDIVSTVRNREFYNYKSFTNNFTISIEGVLFWIKIKNGLLIGDIETPSEELFHIAFKKLKQIAVFNGIGEINIQASPDTKIAKLIKKHSKKTFESWAVGYKNFTSDFPLEQLKFTFGDLDTF
jgi:GNAT superfamily N-acetyltransferase